MSVDSYDELKEHFGHPVAVVQYAGGENIAIECEHCNLVLVDYDHPDMQDAAPAPDPGKHPLVLQEMSTKTQRRGLERSYLMRNPTSISVPADDGGLQFTQFLLAHDPYPPSITVRTNISERSPHHARRDDYVAAIGALCALKGTQLHVTA